MADPADVGGPSVQTGRRVRKAQLQSGGGGGREGGNETKWRKEKRVLILVLARGLLCFEAGVYATSTIWLHSKRRAIELAQTAVWGPKLTHKHVLLLLFL